MQLIGGYDDRGWKDGLLLNAGRPDGTPGVFLGDEFNLANPALLERLSSVLDDERKLVLAEKEGEEIRLHPEFKFIAAMNPPTKDYGGRQKLSKAMQNRFTVISVPDLTEKDELREIARVHAQRLGVPEAVVDTLVELHQWMVQAYKDGTLGKDIRESDRPVYSIRQLLGAVTAVANFRGELGDGDAYLYAVEMCYASLSEDADSKAIMERAKEIAA